MWSKNKQNNNCSWLMQSHRSFICRNEIIQQILIWTHLRWKRFVQNGYAAKYVHHIYGFSGACNLWTSKHTRIFSKSNENRNFTHIVECINKDIIVKMNYVLCEQQENIVCASRPISNTLMDFNVYIMQIWNARFIWFLS